MKKAGFLLVFLLLVPLATASITIDSSFKDKYNVGDKIALSGSVNEGQDTSGLLNFVSICNNASSLDAVRSITLKANDVFKFDENLIAKNAGSCYYDIYVNSFGNNTINDSVTSSTFTVANDLVGNFNTNAADFQLGDTFALNGFVNRLDGSNDNGNAIIYLKNNGLNVLVDNANLVNGEFQYSTNLVNLPNGQYSVDVEVRDINGNDYTFNSVASFNLYNDLIIITQFDKDSYLPGDTTIINGSVYKRDGKVLENSKINVNLDDNAYSTDIVDGKFGINLKLQNNTKSYYHKVSFSVTDDYKNYGDKLAKLYVIPVPTALNIAFNGSNDYSPNGYVNFMVNLYDQANDLLNKQVNINVLDKKSNSVLTNLINSNEYFNFKLDQFALPGNWTINAKYDKLSTSINFAVEPVEKLDLSLSGQILGVHNIGNTDYSKKLDITGNDVAKGKSLSLSPNQSTTVDLGNLFNSGTYSFSVLDKKFDNVVVVGNGLFSGISNALDDVTGAAIVNIKNGSPVLSFIVGGLIILLVLYGLYRIGRVKDDKVDLSNVKTIQQRRNDLEKPMVIQRDEIRPSGSKYGRANESDIADFRKRMYKSVMDESEYRRHNFNFDRPKERKERTFETKENSESNSERSSGLFNMFD